LGTPVILGTQIELSLVTADGASIVDLNNEYSSDRRLLKVHQISPVPSMESVELPDAAAPSKFRVTPQYGKVAPIPIRRY
jgi:hypothetical protein